MQKKRKYLHYIPVALKMSLPQIVIIYLERRVEVSKYWKTPYWKIRFNLFFTQFFLSEKAVKKAKEKPNDSVFFFFSLNQNNKFLRFLLFGTHEATPVNFWQATKRRPISPFWLNNHTNSGLYKRKFFTTWRKKRRDYSDIYIIYIIIMKDRKPTFPHIKEKLFS